MKAMKKILVAAALSVGLVTAAQAHMFVGVGIVGGPVFPVGASSQTAPLLPVYSSSVNSDPAPLPPDSLPLSFAAPVVSSYSTLIGHGVPATTAGHI